VWGDRPAWYFWIGGAPGAYQLQLEDAEIQPDSGCRGVFSIRCYPYADTAFYSGFSAEESGVVESGLFDHTRTPSAESRGRIPDHLFNVAVFELALQANGTAMSATLESLDRMIARNAGPVPRPDSKPFWIRRGSPSAATPTPSGFAPWKSPLMPEAATTDRTRAAKTALSAEASFSNTSLPAGISTLPGQPFP
jgi:hypothetical protein